MRARSKKLYGYVLVFCDAELTERKTILCQTMAEAEEGIRKYVASAFVGSVRDEDILDTLAEYKERVFVFECSDRNSITPFARSFEAA